LRKLAGGRALIPKNDFGCPTLSGLVYERVGSFGTWTPNSARVILLLVFCYCPGSLEFPHAIPST
jgi:hypothetical protein